MSYVCVILQPPVFEKLAIFGWNKYFCVIFVAIFLVKYPSDCPEIFSVCRLSTSDFNEEKLCTYVITLLLYGRPNWQKNAIGLFVCWHSHLRMRKKSRRRPPNTIEVE